MNQMELVSFNKIKVNDVMKEYTDTMHTIYPLSEVTFNGVCYVPIIYDLANALPEHTWAEAEPILVSIVIEEHIFVRWKDDYLNKPIKEVW